MPCVDKDGARGVNKPPPAAPFSKPGATFRMLTTDQSKTLIQISGMDIELERRGKGQPLLLLYGEEGLEPEAPFIDELAKDFEVFIPSPPGFGMSERPDWLRSLDDIAYIYLDLIEKLGLTKLTVMGFSLGGWIAAEMATKDDSRFAKLVLVDAYGVKVGGPFDRDIQDIWLQHPKKVMEQKWHNVEKGKRDFPSMPEDKLAIIARNIETTARLCWEPYMHNPKLKHRLHRIAVPTLVVWGKNDGIVAPTYGKAYSKMIKGAKFAGIAKAGHYPHLEQPEAFMQAISGFVR
jgi:pimeloyl-ACP methyl ester carboxylesterase